MRTSDERLDELHRRMDKRKRDKNNRGFILRSVAVCAVGLAVTVAAAYLVAKAPYLKTEVAEGGIPGSIIATQAALGYIVIGLLAFCLGALVTVFCFRLRKHLEEKNNDRKH